MPKQFSETEFFKFFLVKTSFRLLQPSNLPRSLMKKFNQVIQRGRMGSEPPQSSAGSTLSAKSPLSSPAGSSTFLGSSSAPPMAPRRQIRRGDTHKGLLQASARDRSFTVDHGDLPDASTRRKSYKRSESGAALREDKGLELKIDHHGIVMSSHSNSDGGEIEAIKFAALMAKLSHCFTSTHPGTTPQCTAVD
jgi:hypothetical protein